MWKEFDISTRSTKMEDLGINSDSDAKLSVDLSMIAAYYETFSDKEEEMTNVMLKGGGEFGVFMKYSDFDKLMKKHNANS